MTIEILKSSIVAPSGQKLVMLGGEVYDQKKKGDMIYEFKWVDGEPVMLIYKRVLGHNTPAFMVEFADAYRYARSDGHATKELLQVLCHEAAKAIGVESDKASIFRLIDIMVEGVGILLMMPPEPKALEIANRPSSGNDELCIKINGQTVIETMV